MEALAGLYEVEMDDERTFSFLIQSDGTIEVLDSRAQKITGTSFSLVHSPGASVTSLPIAHLTFLESAREVDSLDIHLVLGVVQRNHSDGPTIFLKIISAFSCLSDLPDCEATIALESIKLRKWNEGQGIWVNFSQGCDRALWNQ